MNTQDKIVSIIETLNQQKDHSKDNNQWDAFNATHDALLNVIGILLKTEIKITKLPASTQEIIRDHSIAYATRS